MQVSWPFRLRCEICGVEREAIVEERQINRLSSGGFSPLRCTACGALSAKPTVRRWELTLADRRFLRATRITPE